MIIYFQIISLIWLGLSIRAVIEDDRHSIYFCLIMMTLFMMASKIQSILEIVKSMPH